MTLDDVRRAAAVHLQRTGQYPTLVGLHPTDYGAINATPLNFGTLVTVISLYGISVVECPDTEPGEIEVLRP